MDENYELIKQWFLENKDRVTPVHPISAHISDLLGRRITKKSMLSVSFASLLVVIRESKSLGNPVKIFLIIPLNSISNKISFQIPQDLKNIQADLCDEPPSIYLKSWEMARQSTIVEEYKIPIKLDLPTEFEDQLYVYYSECRYEIAFVNNWEFSRCIFVEYYPEGRSRLNAQYLEYLHQLGTGEE
jgi:hypothetical protein